MLQSLCLAWMAALSPNSSTQLPNQHAPAPLFTPVAGYASLGARDIPAYSVIAPLAGHRTLVFDGEHFDVLDPAGALQRRLATLPAFVFPSFVAVAPSGFVAYAGESSNDALLRVDLVAGTATQVASLRFNFAACFAAPDELWISAAPCGWSCGSELHALDLATHSLTLRGQLTGASGPVTVTGAGELLYGFQANVVPQPGELWIGKWSASQLANAPLLTPMNATKFARDLDGISSIAADTRGGHVFATVAVGSGFGNPYEIVELDARGERRLVAPAAGTYRSNLVVEHVDGPGALQPFQPRGARLHWVETDFTVSPARSTHHVLEPARPNARIELASTGRRVLRVTGAPANARVSIAMARLSHALVVEHAVPTSSTLLFTALPFTSAGEPIARCDALGALERHWPAAYSGRSVVQLYFLDDDGNPIASAPPILD